MKDLREIKSVHDEYKDIFTEFDILKEDFITSQGGKAIPSSTKKGDICITELFKDNLDYKYSKLLYSWV